MLESSVENGRLSFNESTQPTHSFKVFNRSDVIIKAWYPVCRAKNLKRKAIVPFVILSQKIVVFRDEQGDLHALDAFCPHMGADLSNAKVAGKNIRCYFHGWEFSGKGSLASVPCLKGGRLPGARLSAYPVQEKYGFVWVFSDRVATHEIPNPPGLENQEVSGVFLKKFDLYVHHHILMASGIDLQHFAVVHNLDMDFSYQVSERRGFHEWTLTGTLPLKGAKAWLGRLLFGTSFSYAVNFAGGAITSISYGINQRLFGSGRLLPSLNIVWGAKPKKTGLSEVFLFFVCKKRSGLTGGIKNLILHFLTFVLLLVLKDEDIKAFPNMRFDPGHLLAKDNAVTKLIKTLEKEEVSLWQ